MSSGASGAIDLNQSVSSAYLNRRPSRNAPTQSITRLASSAALSSHHHHHHQQQHQQQAVNANNDQIVYCDPKTGEVESQVERAILDADNPLPFENQEEITLSNNERAFWLNKDENASWRGQLPIDQYRLNVDPNPTVIVKKPKEKIQYRQEVHVKYLKPPTPKPSELIIVQEPNRQLPPAPPLIVRQPAARQPTPEPIIIREAPPQIPEPTRRVIHVPGKVVQAPARKVVVERLPCAPPKPQQVIIERWLKPRIPPPRIIVCKPCDQQQQQPQHPSCPPCPPCHQQQQQQQQHCFQCPPGCEPAQQHQQQHHQQQHHCQPHIHHHGGDRNDIVISIFIE